MVVIVVLLYAAVASFELWLWPERPWKKVLLYLAVFAAAGTLAALLAINPDLKVPEPVGFLQQLIKKWWSGGGGA